MYIGVDESTGLVFEGNSTHGARFLLPLPLLTPAKFVSNTSLGIKLEPGAISSFGIADYLFREDAFDPVTRIRRGRFYKRRTVGQPETWSVMVSPPISADAGTDSRRLISFESIVSADLNIESDRQQIIVLGAGEAFSIWTVVSKETVHTGEILVSLKSRRSFGALPEINWSKVPDQSGLIKAKVGALLDDVYRAGAESIVDRAREVATAILSAHLQSEGVTQASGKDLGDLIELMDKRNAKNVQRIVRCAAEIPQRLHSRAKHAEQEKRDDLRAICEQDAELAVQCVGVMLCDLGWANWH